ncbi:MAG: hypothetical protein IPN90_12085 [Elusimicrobia bacterium]|nr:hypothetical protein [Elusimicrobiota bacterium]
MRRVLRNNGGKEWGVASGGRRGAKRSFQVGQWAKDVTAAPPEKMAGLKLSKWRVEGSAPTAP